MRQKAKKIADTVIRAAGKSMSGTSQRHLAALSLNDAGQQFFRSTPTVLKTREYRLFPNKHRLRLPYEMNFSAALSLPLKDDELEQIHQNPLTFLARTQESIVEHANRRVDLFFLTLIAYYNTKLEPIMGYTTLQHGKGRNPTGQKNLTQACHSSFIPSLVDGTILKNNKKSILSGTHLMDSLNTTMELPAFVNAFDDLLENNCLCRKHCIDILSQVALGTLNPIQGLTEFLIMMSDVLSKLKEEVDTSSKHHSMLGKPKISATLIELVKKGTFSTTFSEEKQVVSDEYIQSILCLTAKERTLCANGYKERQRVYMNKMANWQHIILTTPSALAQTDIDTDSDSDSTQPSL